MSLYNQFLGSMMGGAIGDALGGEFENQEKPKLDPNLYVWGQVRQPDFALCVSDDTQLTMATCEAIIKYQQIDAAQIANQFLQWYQANRLTGLGSATLQALQGMSHGGHWALVGKKGERAAGNGAAMRIAPLAFWEHGASRASLRDICRITHHNEEAYVGALAVYLAIRSIIEGEINTDRTWLDHIAHQLPDTRVRDRIWELSALCQSHDLLAISTLHGNRGYVVESVPFALVAVVQSVEKGFEQLMHEVIDSGGDTDSNASIFGQIAGTRLGYKQLPEKWIHMIEQMDEYAWMELILSDWEEQLVKRDV